MRIDAIDRFLEREFPLSAFVVHEAPIARISEPDATVGMHDHIVWGIERFALITIRQHGDAAIILGARHPARAMLARDEAPLPVTGVAVGVIGRLAEHTDCARLFSPAQHPVVGNIAPQQIAPIPKPAGAFGPQCPGVESLHRGMAEGIGLEAWVEDPDSRIWVSDRAHPTPISASHCHRALHDCRPPLCLDTLPPLRASQGYILLQYPFFTSQARGAAER